MMNINENVKDHEEHLASVLERIRQHGFKLSKKKCELSRLEIKYMGQIINKNTYKADPEHKRFRIYACSGGHSLIIIVFEKDKLLYHLHTENVWFKIPR